MEHNGWDRYYPRPQLRRNSFFPLNHGWTLNGRPIEVPWPPQAPLSRWEGAVGDELRYQTSVTLPEKFCPTAFGRCSTSERWTKWQRSLSTEQA